jgi:hypothetical protein
MCRHFFFALGHSLTRKSFWKLCELTFKGAVSGYPKIPFTNTFGNRFFISVEYYIDKIPCGTVVFKPDKSVSVLNFHHLLNYVGKIKIFLNWGFLITKVGTTWFQSLKVVHKFILLLEFDLYLLTCCILKKVFVLFLYSKISSCKNGNWQIT